jgi:hypothetical protein
MPRYDTPGEHHRSVGAISAHHSAADTHIAFDDQHAAERR